MIKFIAWSCEFNKNTGEGQLARKFIESNFDTNWLGKEKFY